MAELLVAGAVVGGVGAIRGGQARAEQAKSQRSIARFNSIVADREATAQERKGEFQQRRQGLKAARDLGTLRAKLGASGVAVSGGAASALVGEQVAESTLENMLIGFESDIEASRLRTQSGLFEQQAQAFGQQRGEARLGALFGAGQTLLTGFGQASALRQSQQARESSRKGIRKLGLERDILAAKKIRFGR